MRRYHFYLNEDLFNSIKELASTNNMSISKMMIKLLEIGYISLLTNNIK